MEEFNIQGKQTSFYKYYPGTFGYILYYILPKHPHITKLHTHTHTHTLQNNIKPLQYKLNDTCIFFDRFSRNPHISNSMKIRPMGARVVPRGWLERRTATTKRRVAFLNFAHSSTKRHLRLC